MPKKKIKKDRAISDELETEIKKVISSFIEAN